MSTVYEETPQNLLCLACYRLGILAEMKQGTPIEVVRPLEGEEDMKRFGTFKVIQLVRMQPTKTGQFFWFLVGFLIPKENDG